MTKIYHYTSIESLALILSTGTLRFTRLDRVDDVREAQTHSGVPFGKYFFVSCWTQDAEESIPQWNMYSKDMQGVRLEMPMYPFRRVELRSSPNLPGISVADPLFGPLSMDELLGDTYFVMPPFSDDWLGGPANYVLDVGAHYADAVSRSISGSTEQLAIADLRTLPRLKSKSWQFQAEYRFHLFIVPAQPTVDAGTSRLTLTADQAAALLDGFRAGRDPGIDHFDIPLSPAVLDKLIVRTGPRCSRGGEVIVQSLLNQFAPRAAVETSALSGTIRAQTR